MSRVRPANYRLRIPQRATLEEVVVLKAGNVPLNLTGYTFSSQVWKTEKRREKVIDLTVEILDAEEGKIKISLTRSQTREIKTGGFWDLLVIEPSGAADYWLEGEAVLDLGLSDT